MPKVTNQTAQQVQDHCGPNDQTAPPTPGIVSSMAFDKAKDGSTVRTDQSGGGMSAGRRDPAYIELSNVEIGTHIELINLSANPEAEFDDKNTIKLELTGRDVKARTGAVYLKQSQMEKLGLKPGDMYQLRAVDGAGNASAPVSAELQGNEWANGRVIEDGNWAGRGRQINALDGEGARKAVIAKAVNDARPPMVLEDNVAIETKGNGQKAMVFDKAIEPQAQVRVQNSRTGQSFAGTVNNDGQLTVALKGVEEGDPLLVSVTDNNGNAGKDLEIVYSKKCKDGKAPKLQGGLSTRLPGVI
jgi:hypothetical protein